MPNFSLSPGQGVDVPGGQILTITVTPRNGPAPRLVVISDQTPPPKVHSPKPGMLLVPGSAGDVTVRAIAPAGGAFVGQLGIDLQIIVGSQDLPDPYVVRIGPVDLSGLHARDLVHVTAGAKVRLMAAAGTASAGGGVLDPLGALALADARTVLGGERLRDDHMVGADVVIDRSASMRRLWHDGSVGAVLSVLSGCLQTVARGGKCRPGTIGAELRWADEVDSSQLPRAVDTLMDNDNGGWSQGVALATLRRGSEARDPERFVYFLTDAFPVPTEHRDVAGMTVVALADPSVWNVMRPLWPGRAALAPCIGARDLRAELMSAAPERAALVRSLVDVSGPEREGIAR